MQCDLVDFMGTDLTCVDSARVSFNKRSTPVGNEAKKIEVDGEYYNINIPQLSDRDKRLLDYLARNGHWTPFGHPTVTFRITAPIFVRAQMFKHKQGLVENEVSRRYVDDEPEFWQPDVWRQKPQNAKQGSSDVLDQPEKIVADAHYKDTIETCRRTYEILLNHGVAPEQARAVLPQAMYTSWYWTGSLFAFARVCYLRLDSHAQQETGEIAQMINHHCQLLFPQSWGALMNNAK